MNPHFKTVLIAALAGVWLAGPLQAAPRHKKHPVRTDPAAETFWGSLVPMGRDGNPIIIKGDHLSRAAPAEPEPQQRTGRPVRVPRGSSSYVDIPLVNPSPYSGNSPPAPQLLQRQVEPYKPPPINSFSDRVTNCIHSYPLNAGIGNNPTDQQTYIRQCAN
jgi:hypothetical protein